MQVGFIGTGLMGLPMAERILGADFSLTAYNRTLSKLEPLKQAGADVVSVPEAVIRSSSCIVLMLTNAAAIREVLLSETAGREIAGKTIIQMGTISPTESRSLQSDIQAVGGDYLEAPVLGSIPEAKAGKLIVMVGGTAEQYERWLGVLTCFGPTPTLVGPVGTAAAVKLALNQLIGSLTAAFATSLGLVMQQGVAVEAFMQILRNSALYAPTFDKKLQRMVECNYENPNFPVKHLTKDIDLFLQESASLALNTSAVVGVRQVLAQTLQMGLADADYSALFSAIVKAQELEG